MSAPLAPADVNASQADWIPPLAGGALFFERYTVNGLIEREPGRNVYRLNEARACRNCGVENEGSASDCGFCGAALPPAPEAWLVEQPVPAAHGALPPSSFIFDDYLYTLLPPEGAVAASHSTLQHGMVTEAGIRRGLRGEASEDAVFALSAAAQPGAPCGMYLVADGVGGAADGEVVSRLAVDTAVRKLQTCWLAPLLAGKAVAAEETRAALNDAFCAANQAVIAYAQAHQVTAGTTLAAALVWGKQLVLANVGDCRIYLLRADELKQLSRDHSYVASLVENGSLSPEEIYTHPQRNVIVKSMGDESGFEFELAPAESGALALRPADRLLLCSDGLWEMARDGEMARVLSAVTDPQAAAAQLSALANGAGGADNISVIVVHV